LEIFGVYLIPHKLGRDRNVTVFILLIKNRLPVRSTIFHPFPRRIFLIIEAKLAKMLNNITFIITPIRDILKSQPKVVVDIDMLVKFLVCQPVSNLSM
jgi:hypothetical protein